MGDNGKRAPVSRPAEAESLIGEVADANARIVVANSITGSVGIICLTVIIVVAIMKGC